MKTSSEQLVANLFAYTRCSQMSPLAKLRYLRDRLFRTRADVHRAIELADEQGLLDSALEGISGHWTIRLTPDGLQRARSLAP